MSVALNGTICVFTATVIPTGVYLYLNVYLDKSMPKFVPIKSPTSGKFGFDFQPYLVDATDNDTTNDLWWKWSYDNKYEPDKNKENSDLSTEFGGKNNFSELKTACNTAYSKATDTELKDSNASDNKNKYGRDAWKYCSPFDSKPKTIEDNKDGTDKDNLNTTSGAYKDGWGSHKKSELVSVTDTGSDNELFWIFKDAEFFGEDTDGKGKYTQDDASKKTIFNKLYDQKGKPLRETIKDTCKVAYTKNKDNTTAPDFSESDILKFCGLKQQQAS